MAAAKFACPACRAVLQLSKTPPAGAKIRCPKCNSVFTVRVPARPTAVPAGAGAGAGARPAVGGSSLKLKEPGGTPPPRPAARPAPPPPPPPARASSAKLRTAPPPTPEPPVDEYDDEPAPRPKKPKKKAASREATLIGVFIGLGALLLVIVVVVVVILFTGGDKGSQFSVDEKRQQEMDEFLRNRGTGRGSPTQNQQAPPNNNNDGNPSGGGGGFGNPSGSGFDAPQRGGPGNPLLSQNNPPRGVATGGSSGNPFSNLNVGSLAARTPQDLEVLSLLPPGAEVLQFLDVAALGQAPALRDWFWNALAADQLVGKDHPIARVFAQFPPDTIDYILEATRTRGLMGVFSNPAQATSAIEYQARVFHMKQRIDRDNLLVAVRADPGPNVSGFSCLRLGSADLAGTKFHSFLLFPEEDDRTVIVAISQKDDPGALVRGGLTSTQQSLLVNVEPSHFWVSASLEGVKPLLSMAGMATGNMPPDWADDLKPILAEMPRAQGLVFSVRMQNNVLRGQVGLTFDTPGPSAAVSSSLNSLWNSKLRSLVQSGAGESQIAGAIAQSTRITVRGSAVNVTMQVSSSAMASDFPKMARAFGEAAASIGTATAGTFDRPADSPAPSPTTPPPVAANEDNPPPTESYRPGGGGRSRSNPNAPYGLEVNMRAPELEGADADGKRFKLSDYRGKVVVLDFWGYWCPPCRSMIPHGRDLVERLKDAPFAFLGVNSDPLPEYNRWKQQEPITWRCFMDKSTRGPLTKKYDISAFPTLFLIDGNGVIRHKFVGVPPNAVFDKAINDLIAELMGG
ncbi:MAG TPA: redoxin domain-containing protein [Gemmatales bacterium]|nr:redoxin domain-containing protein [Gemmatales bacterium]